MERRQQAKEAAAAEAAARREQAAATALSGTGNDGASDGIAPETVSGNVLKDHKSKRGTVWQVFDLSVEHPTCTVLKPNGDRCGVQPAKSAGTSNYWNHLWSHHKQIWYELRMKDGTLNAAGVTELTTLKEIFAKMAQVESSGKNDRGGEFLSATMPPATKHIMDRVTSEWVIDDNQAFNAAESPAFRFMMSSASNGKYDGCCNKTVQQHVHAMAVEGKTECTEFHMNLLGQGIKPAASGDLWSKNSTALFGLVSHGIRRSEHAPEGGVKWEMVEKLAGSVPCSKFRHTGEHIGTMSDTSWKETGISKPTEEIFARVSDNGSNMISGWQEGFQTPCADHTLELSVKLYTEHPDLAPTFDKGRGLVGYFNRSVVGYNEEGRGLYCCQETSGQTQKKLVQDVKTRWRSTHAMTDSLRENMEPLVLYDVRNPKPAEGFKENRYSLEDWEINNQSVASLHPLASASQMLEGKNYPTSNLVLPSMYGCIESLSSGVPVRQPWQRAALGGGQRPCSFAC